MADREKVIKGLECQYKPRMTCYGCDYFIARDKLCNKNKIFRAAVDLLKAQEPGWISVKDKLPPSHEFVFVSINDDRGDYDYRYTDTGWYLSEGKCWIVDNEATISVEAWMPYPKPYKPPKEE